jgi:hypothetical protein
VLLREIMIEGIERMKRDPTYKRWREKHPDSSDNSTHIFDGGKQLPLIESKQKVLLGYEAGSGNAVYIPTDMNIAATGQTRRTGKAPALEAIITRGKFTCLTFRTKRGESGFLRGVHINPFYRARADWVYVKSLAEAALEKTIEIEGKFLSF